MLRIGSMNIPLTASRHRTSATATRYRRALAARRAKTKRTELLFVALFLRLLKPGGRAAVIVPGLSCSARRRRTGSCAHSRRGPRCWTRSSSGPVGSSSPTPESRRHLTRKSRGRRGHAVLPRSGPGWMAAVVCSMVVSPPNRSTEDRVAARSFSFRRPPMGCARGPREAQRGAAGGPCKALQLEQRSDSFVTPGRLWPGRRQGPMTTNPRRCRHYVEVGGPGQPPDRNVIVILAHYGGRRHPLLLGHKPIWSVARGLAGRHPRRI
jgi:hypothetical protein